MRRSFVLRMGLALILALGCATPKGSSVAGQRSHILGMRAEVLRDLEAARPGIGERIRSASGYAVFSSVNVQLFFWAAARATASRTTTVPARTST